MCGFWVYTIFQLSIMFNISHSTEITQVLGNLLNQFEEKFLILPDTCFGMSLAQGLIAGSHCEKNQSASILKFKSFVHEKITQLKSKDIIGGLENMSIYKQIIFKNIMASQWNLTSSLIYNILPKTSSIHVWKTYLQKIDEGEPSRYMSDYCLAQILATNSCSINIKCTKLLQQRKESYGYHKTHQILIAHLMMKNKCNSWIPFSTTMRFILSDLCSQVYQEVLTIFSYGIPNEFRDLFLEQVLLCGISGFTEFFNKTFIINILTWTNSNGCFSSNMDEENSCGEDCQNHITSLGISFLTHLIQIASIS